jgi:hypothetical protein
MQVFGRLDPFSEQGSEGIHWSLVDSSYPGYGGLFRINGKQLKILDKDFNTIWQGSVKLEYQRNKETCGTWTQQAVSNAWVHGFEETLSPEVWAEYFFQNCRAILDTDEGLDPWKVGDLSGLPARLAAMPDKDKQELYRQAVYGVLREAYTGGPLTSFTEEWGLTTKEVVSTFDITAAEIGLIKTWPKYGHMLDITFSENRFVKAILFHQIKGVLEFLCNTREEKQVLIEPYRAIIAYGAIADLIQVFTRLRDKRDALLRAAGHVVEK